MRIYLSLSANLRTIPYNYQELLTGVIHKWIGPNNDVHGSGGKYSFSWLQNTKGRAKGIDLSIDSYFFIGSMDESLIKQIIRSILFDPTMFCGIKVVDIQMKSTPAFGSEACFHMASPVLLKIKENDRSKFVTIEDSNFERTLTESFKKRLEHLDLDSGDVSIELNTEHKLRKTKLVTYKGVSNKASVASIIIKGTPAQIAFAWSNGIGHSTGIGFGSLK